MPFPGPGPLCSALPPRGSETLGQSLHLSPSLCFTSCGCCRALKTPGGRGCSSVGGPHSFCGQIQGLTALTPDAVCALWGRGWGPGALGNRLRAPVGAFLKPR